MIEGRAPGAIRYEWKHRAHVGTNVRHHRAEREVIADRLRPSTFGLVAVRTQARDALVGLGWKVAIAGAAVQEAYARVGTAATIDVLIREALRRCPKPTSST